MSHLEIGSDKRIYQHLSSRLPDTQSLCVFPTQKPLARARNKNANIGRVRNASITGFSARLRFVRASAISISSQIVAQTAVARKTVKAPIAKGFETPFINKIASTTNQFRRTAVLKAIRSRCKSWFSKPNVFVIVSTLQVRSGFLDIYT